ncbi:MAG TPA: acetylglutamate kinase [Gaiellaceae bacterium]|nr:acetylglutamate kinase [Gaiellaceae bacterium]
MPACVVKCGGSVAGEAVALVRPFLDAGNPVVVVHGAGPQISAEMERRGLAVEFVRGRRVTTPEGLAVVREAMATVNAALCQAIGARAIGLMGDEIGLLATRVPELGEVGDPVPVAPPAVLGALAAGLIPVIAPLAAGPLNVNADEAASALAIGLGAERILFLTDVPGLLLAGAVVSRIAADDAAELLDAGALQGGIQPKLHAAVAAARQGVRAEIGRTAVVA